MMKTQISTQLRKIEGRTIVEYVMLGFILCIIILRCVSSEGINLQTPNQPLNLGNILYSLSISTILIFLFLVWLVWNFCKSQTLYRYSSMEIGAGLFIMAALASIYTACDKRVAITDFTIMLAPILIGIILTQILNSYLKIKIFLYTLASLGALAALYSFVQFFWINDIMLEQYRADPNIMLSDLNIARGSLQQMLLEHSLYSRDVRSFFTTGNSAGSFYLLTFFTALALLIENINAKKPTTHRRVAIIFSVLFTLIIVAGLLVTRSKGAIAATLIAAILFAMILLFGRWLNAHKKTVLLICLLAVIIAIYFIISYGLAHGRLPGGNSMLVRWQYWHASAQMYADHPFTGVGPGNFTYFYSHYKPPAGIETVANPHNFILSLLTQYGPLGLVGFLAAIFMPLSAMVFSNTASVSKNVTRTALFVAVLGFLIHNCIDFAIFEPPVLTVFWVITACLTAMHLTERNQTAAVTKTPLLIKILIAAGAMVIMWLCSYYILTPVTKTTDKIIEAHQAASYGQFTLAHDLLTEAAKDDLLDEAPAALNARFYYAEFQIAGAKNQKPLISARDCLLEAIRRNDADYKNFDNLSDVYIGLAKINLSEDFLKKAADALCEAIKRYPASDRLHFQLAQLAEQLVEKETALREYKTAVSIEDAYQEQFKTMYPGQRVFSRLGEEQYQTAKQKIKELSESLSPAAK